MKTSKDTRPHVYSPFPSVEVPFHIPDSKVHGANILSPWTLLSGIIVDGRGLWVVFLYRVNQTNTGGWVGSSLPNVLTVVWTHYISKICSLSRLVYRACTILTAMNSITMKDWTGHNCVSIPIEYKNTFSLLWCAMVIAFHVLQKICCMKVLIAIHFHIWPQYKSITAGIIRPYAAFQ